VSVMRAAISCAAIVLALVGCGSEAAAPDPAPAASAPAEPEGRPGEAAIVARFEAAQADVARIQAEQQRLLAEAAPSDDEARRLGRRRVVELDHELGLALVARDEAELDFYALACPDAAGSIAESHRGAAEDERRGRATWLTARLESVDADIALTALIEDEQVDDDATASATERTEAASARRDELEEAVSEVSDRRADLRLDAREACDERLPTAR